MELNCDDRIYKTIDASIGNNKFMRILSKIDKSENIYVEFYYFNNEDINKNDGTIKNKRNGLISKQPINIDKFDYIINNLPMIYPEFKIMGMTDHSNLTLKETIEKIKDLGYGKVNDI